MSQRAVEAVWRIESARIVGALARMTRDVGLAEELAQDALVTALERWPLEGVPDNPGAWLMAAAKRRAFDRLRHARMAGAHQEQMALDAAALGEPEAPEPDAIGDDLLRLVFTACHPVLSPEARVALTLKLLGGLATDEIARAFLVPEATVAQRIVRAKRTLAAARVPFEVPAADELPQRMASVLEVIYLVFNEGYLATAGTRWLRHELCDEALRLGRIVAGLLPQVSEVQGLLALMEIQASRNAARTAADGTPVLLLEQDRGRWDRLLVQRGLEGVARCEAMGALGPYALQASIAACHARAATPAETDWVRICALYDALAALTPSPVVELNRAVAVAMAYGPLAGLQLVDALRDEPALKGYHLLPAVRADLLLKLGRAAEAADEFRRAAALTRNERERALLLARVPAPGQP